MWPSLTTPLPTPLFIVMASPLPYSRMIFEATCGTISKLGLIKLSSDFSTLASPHATQSTSSEDYPKGVVSARPYSEYLSLILFTNSEQNAVIHLGHHLPNPHTLRPGSTTHIWIGGLLYVDDLARISICPRELQSMHLSTLEYSKSHANQHSKDKNNGLLRNTCPRPCPVNTSPAQPCPPITCTHPFQPPTPARTLSTKSPNLSTLALFWILNSLCTSQLWKPYAVLPRVRPSL